MRCKVKGNEISVDQESDSVGLYRPQKKSGRDSLINNFNRGKISIQKTIPVT